MFRAIDGLFVGTRYGVLGLSVLGIAGSVVMFFANIGLGASSALLCVAALALCIALVLLLLPKAMTKRKVVIAVGCLLVAFAVTGITCYGNGGFPGNGLGLSLVLRILQLTGGSVSVDSEPSRGTVFQVRLPKVPEGSDRIWAR